MKPVKFKGMTITLLQPPGISKDECGTLPVYRGGGYCASRWKFSFRELLSVLLNRHIWIYVWSGDSQPPIALDTQKSIFEKPRKDALLRIAQEYCDREDKSTEFMIQYMEDYAGVSYRRVMRYLTKKGGFKEVKK